MQKHFLWGPEQVPGQKIDVLPFPQKRRNIKGRFWLLYISPFLAQSQRDRFSIFFLFPAYPKFYFTLNGYGPHLGFWFASPK